MVNTLFGKSPSCVWYQSVRPPRAADCPDTVSELEAEDVLYNLRLPSSNPNPDVTEN